MWCKVLATVCVLSVGGHAFSQTPEKTCSLVSHSEVEALFDRVVVRNMFARNGDYTFCDWFLGNAKARAGIANLVIGLSFTSTPSPEHAREIVKTSTKGGTAVRGIGDDAAYLWAEPASGGKVPYSFMRMYVAAGPSVVGLSVTASDDESGTFGRVVDNKTLQQVLGLMKVFVDRLQ